MELQKVVEDADRFRVLAPSGAHTRFRLQKRNARSGKWKTIKLEALDKINRSFLSDNSTKEKSKEKCQLLLKELYTARDSLKPVAVFHSENINILKSYWKEKYPPRKQKRMVAPEAAYGDLKRAIEACENLPLDSVLADTLQDHIDEKFSTQTNKQRRICVWLNMILKWLDRDFKLEGFPPERKNIKHLTLQEFNKVVPYFKRWDMKVLARVAFHTGLRQGECFAIELSNIREKTLLVSSQLDRYKEITDTKTKGVRKVYISPRAKEALVDWMDIPNVEKLKLRSLRIADKTKKACTRAFPENREKWCVFHDLRHSYAINLLSAGIPLSHVAQSLGNSNEVCERYYTGFTLSDESVDLIERMLKKI